MSDHKIVILSILGLSLAQAVSAGAVMNGHLFTSETHQLVITRPDATWELREKIPLPSAVCAFVVDGGSAAVVLSHLRLQGDQILRDINDLAENRDLLNDLITRSLFIEPGNLELKSSDYREVDGRIQFGLIVNNREPERGPLENHIIGFILRDNADTQHLYALRCATTLGSYLLWESQFDRIRPTLAFTGEVALPVYRSRPTPIWWWIGGGIVALIFLSLLFGRGNTEPTTLTRAPHRVRTPEVVAEAMAPVDIADESDSSYADVPDFLRHSVGDDTAPAGAMPSDALAQPHPTAAATGTHPELAETTAPAIGASYWTCACGRKNVGSDSFCSRCNADRAHV